MKFKKTLIACAAVLGIIFISACKKNVAGPQGDPGLPGQNGNSNQYSSVAFDIKPSVWDSIDNGVAFDWKHTVFIPEISKQVMSAGEVKAYTLIGEDWFPLPTISNLVSTQCSVAEGKVIFKVSHIHGGLPPRPLTQKFRVFILGPK